MQKRYHLTVRFDNSLRVVKSLFLCFFAAHFIAQPSLNFLHLAVQDGLNDSYIGDICEDKYGYMWFISFGAINRFDGSRVERFTHIPGDTTSPLISNPYTIFCDAQGRLWIGYADGFLEYQYETKTFRRVPSLMGRGVFTIVTAANGKLYMRTYRGLLCFNPDSDQLETLGDPADSTHFELLNKTRTSTIYASGEYLYLGFDRRIVEYHTRTHAVRIIEIPGMKGNVDVIIKDSSGRFWVSGYADFELRCLQDDGSDAFILDSLLSPHPEEQSSAAADLFLDEDQRLWIATNQSGLILYDIRSYVVKRFREDDHLGTSITSNLLKLIYRDSRGIYWLGSVFGVDYFNPDWDLFDVMYPYADQMTVQYARGVTQDKEGNFWFTTSDGIVRHTPQTNSYTYWRNSIRHPNRIYHNSSRGVMEDSQGRIWFVTAEGVNRLHPKTGKVDFLTEADGLPRAFYIGVYKDAQENLWFGTNTREGLYYYSPADDTIRSIRSYPGLDRFAGNGGRYVYEDSRGRIWLGFNGGGLGMYDRNSGESKYWYNNGMKSDSTIIGNLIIDIKEDQTGVVWISTLNGITGVDLEHNRFTSFNDKNGLRSNVAGPLAVDALNRLWVGMSNGLVMIDSARINFTYFNEDAGIPVPSFTDYPSCSSHDGEIVMPTIHGYVRFNPLKYRETPRALESYLISFSVFDREYPLPVQNASQAIKLKPDENFFTFTLGSLNFYQAPQTWYAYQLVGFDRDWRYTQDPKAVYTNVPGGKYLFRYKASPDVRNWGDAQNSITVRIGKMFYETLWFWGLIACTFAALIYWIYRNRINAQRAVLELRNKAQLLEKEKAVVQYESLKQQLNPHFLFNSLTSLSSLISMDQNVAADFLDSLSKTYRYILKSSESETVSLGEEIRFAQTYVKLQLTRFESGLQVNFDVDEGLSHRKIVPVTIQNLIENAIKHNIIDIDSPLIIRIGVQDNYLVVTNNLQRKNFVETSNKQGIANLKALYHYLSDRQVEVLDDTDTFTVKIPLL